MKTLENIAIITKSDTDEQKVHYMAGIIKGMHDEETQLYKQLDQIKAEKAQVIKEFNALKQKIKDKDKDNGEV